MAEVEIVSLRNGVVLRYAGHEYYSDGPEPQEAGDDREEQYTIRCETCGYGFCQTIEKLNELVRKYPDCEEMQEIGKQDFIKKLQDGMRKLKREFVTSRLVTEDDIIYAWRDILTQEILDR